jgi:hypothetical protein
MTARRAAIWFSAFVLLGLAVLPLGCVRRTMTVRTEPEGARVLLNDEVVGTSPVTVDFTWYGDYDVTCRKDGYETLHTHHRIKPPWYQVPPFDFFAEGFTPFTLHDKQEMSFTLEPAKEVNRPELIERAKEFRDRAIFAEQ